MCARHGCLCSVPETKVDVLQISMPCDPFSDNSNNRWKASSSEEILEQDGVKEIVQGMLSTIAKLRPSLIIFENVPGIQKGPSRKRRADCDPASPLDLIIAKIKEVAPDYCWRVHQGDASLFGPMPRARVFLLMASHEAGGETLIANAFEKINVWEKEIRAQTLDEILSIMDGETVHRRLAAKEAQSNIYGLPPTSLVSSPQYMVLYGVIRVRS